MPTKRYALDSSFIISFLKGEEKAAETYGEIKSGEIKVPAPVLLETLRGVESIGNFRHLENPEFGPEEAEEALEIIEFLEENGEMIGIIDVMIAAIASENRMKIVTFDSDFKELEEYGLEVMRID
jgi:predicted nucleic acid-binding protein